MATHRASDAAGRLPRGVTAAESTADPATASLGERLAGPALGFSLNGFWIYLGVLAAGGIEPRTAVTGVYYAALGLLLSVLAWQRRSRIAERLVAGGRTAAVFFVSTVLLAAWFLASAAFLSAGTGLSRRLAALLLFWSLPSALLALSLTRRQLQGALGTVLALGLTFVAVDVLALGLDTGGDLGDRFSPIHELDPITAGKIPALAALAALCLLPRGRRLALARLPAVFVLAAFTVVPGSRGPVAALVVGSGVALALAWRSTGPAAIAALVLGLGVGLGLGAAIGSSRHLTSVPGADGETGAISSANIRRQLVEKAIRAVPDAPLAGNGVGTLVDDTPEAHRMGIAGRHTYPHNVFVEALYSLGIFGLALLMAALASAAWALVRLVRDGPGLAVAFAAAFFCFAIVDSTLTGELAADALLWTAAALGIGLLGARALHTGGPPSPSSAR